jgi:hypothetical protein
VEGDKTQYLQQPRRKLKTKVTGLSGAPPFILETTYQHVMMELQQLLLANETTTI